MEVDQELVHQTPGSIAPAELSEGGDVADPYELRLRPSQDSSAMLHKALFTMPGNLDAIILNGAQDADDRSRT